MSESAASSRAVPARGAVLDALLLVVLVVLTVLNFAVGDAHPSTRGWWIALILGIAFVKATAIGFQYMMLRAAPRVLMAGLVGWALVFFGLTTALAIL